MNHTIAHSNLLTNGSILARIAVFLSALGLIYYSVLTQLFHSWLTNHYYSHGFLIPLITCYLIFRERKKIRTLVFRPGAHGLLVVVFGIFLFLLDRFSTQSLFLSSCSMLIAILGGIVLLFGIEYLRVLLFPILFLLFSDRKSVV